jgi:hypothetical protein
MVLSLKFKELKEISIWIQTAIVDDFMTTGEVRKQHRKKSNNENQLLNCTLTKENDYSIIWQFNVKDVSGKWL